MRKIKKCKNFKYPPGVARSQNTPQKVFVFFEANNNLMYTKII